MKPQQPHQNIQTFLEQSIKPEHRDQLSGVLCQAAAYETYKSLENELFLHGTGPTALINSAQRGDGRSTIALILSAFTSQMNPDKKVLLVDADIENAGLTTWFLNSADAPGIADYYRGEASFDDCIQPTSNEGLFFVPACRDNSLIGRLSPTRLKAFAEQASANFDLVVFDSPAGGSNNDLSVMAEIIQQLFLVVRYEGATREQIGVMLTEIQRTDVNILGAVLNRRRFVIPNLFYGRER
jgi:Mrp family chromosome partitioning ATPase